MIRAAARKKTSSPVAEHLMSYLDFAVGSPRPFDHWLAENVLPEDVLDDVSGLPIVLPANMDYDGTRDSNKARFYFTAENQEKHFVCREVASLFHDPSVVGTLEAVTGADLTQGYLHIEYCQDADGFWLEPTTGTPNSLLTMEITLSGDRMLQDAGIDLCDDTDYHTSVVRLPYDKGNTLILIPGGKSWHGFVSRSIKGVRKSLIINYVTHEWPQKDELA